MTASDEQHELFKFMAQISREMASEYERIHARAREDPGTAGDEGEENWAEMLRGWLPATYQIETKGRLIRHDGRMTPQIDIVVLKPSYPRRLLKKKVFLAGGVAAAFECKATLTAAHVATAVGTCAKVKSLFEPRRGSPYRELRAPILFGLLAHSHSWKAPNSSPLPNITNALLKADETQVTHPRLGLDVLCVVDVRPLASLPGPSEGCVRTIYFQMSDQVSAPRRSVFSCAP